MDLSKYKLTDPLINQPICPIKPRIPIGNNPEDFVQYSKNLANYNQERKIWDDFWADRRDKENALYNQFKIDALTELGVINHPKADKLYSIAYQIGHAYGLSDIWGYLNELKPLID